MLVESSVKFKAGSLIRYKCESILKIGIIIYIGKSSIWDDYAEVLWYNGKIEHSFTDNLELLG